ncbi:F0F1 ATP synthase subunit B [Ancylothrix sp. C2]|uniref:F0F1 ATP synthase subunit B n=1 Tax=Ancylothrix sp. D3o TaxID=2953691 RepID=UPI0021BA6CB6|nr:F0F1 ATP synthase subunit B [Ancylothrix sp. D3o]MCT7949438.1 F0F1 ATP synthase subunit B [Ancylothrix sp. D3o]
MGTFWLLATAAEAVETELEHGGFGLNFDLFETNLINLAIIIGVLFYFGRGFLGNVLSERRNRIETAIKEAEQKLQEAATSLSEGQQKLTQAQAEAERIRAAAQERAKAAKEAIMAQAIKDVERLRADSDKDLETEKERVVNELRARVAAMALQKVESQLKERLDDNAQGQLIDRSIAMLGGR